MKLYIWFQVEKKELPVQVLTTPASISPAHMKRVLLAVTSSFGSIAFRLLQDATANAAATSLQSIVTDSSLLLQARHMRQPLGSAGTRDCILMRGKPCLKQYSGVQLLAMPLLLHLYRDWLALWVPFRLSGGWGTSNALWHHAPLSAAGATAPGHSSAGPM